MINSAGSVDNTQDSSYQCGHSDVAHSEPLRENAAKTDPASLLTAAPLAEFMRESIKNYPLSCGGRAGHIGARNCHACEWQEALTQHEALIKHSEAVWAVVEKSKQLKKVRKKYVASVAGLSMAEFVRAESEFIVAVEALEMMEKDNVNQLI